MKPIRFQENRLPRAAKLIGVAVFMSLISGGWAASFDGADDFADESRNISLWGADMTAGIGGLLETNGHLHYRTTAGNPMIGDYSGRPWLQIIRATNDWEVRIKANVPDITMGNAQHYAFGLFVTKNGNTADQQVIMLSNESADNTPGRSFYAISFTNSTPHYEGEITTTARSGLVRLRWDAGTFQLASQFSTDGGSSWSDCGPPVGQPWGVTSNDWFSVGPAGYSENMSLSVGDNLYGDDFQTVGQRPEITAIGSNGTLTFSDALTNAYYTIEWAAEIEGPWYRDWNQLAKFLKTNDTTTLRIPVFYRAVRE